MNLLIESVPFIGTAYFFDPLTSAVLGYGVLQYHNSHHAIIGCRPCQGKLK